MDYNSVKYYKAFEKSQIKYILTCADIDMKKIFDDVSGLTEEYVKDYAISITEIKKIKAKWYKKLDDYSEKYRETLRCETYATKKDYKILDANYYYIESYINYKIASLVDYLEL